jgi:flavin-binding protein dodecin
MPNEVSNEYITKLTIPDDIPGESSFKAYIEAKIYDKGGHLIQYHRQPMRSLTEYFLALMSIPIVGTSQSSSSANATGILTNVLGLPGQQTSYSTNANISWDWAIQIGSGTQNFSVTLRSLAAPIANGTGPGQLAYGQMYIYYGNTSITVSITVTNYSTSTVTITEIGLIGYVYMWYENANYNFAYDTYSYLLSYDVFSTPISLSPGGIATFQITLSFTG